LSPEPERAEHVTEYIEIGRSVGGGHVHQVP